MEKGSLPVGIQLFSVRNEMDDDPYGTLKKIKEIGFDGIETCGFYGYEPAQFGKVCKDLGLCVISVHNSFETMCRDTEKTAVDYSTAGCRYAAIPYAALSLLPYGEKYDEFRREVERISTVFKEHGITLMYHDHEFEFERHDGRFILDELYSDIPADILQCEIDTCWATVGTGDAAAYLMKYAGRLPIVHLKDFTVDKTKTQNYYDVVGINSGEKDRTEYGFEFRTYGDGEQDAKTVIAAAKNAGAAWLVYEQDEPCFGLSPIECAKKSYENISAAQ